MAIVMAAVWLVKNIIYQVLPKAQHNDIQTGAKKWF